MNGEKEYIVIYESRLNLEPIFRTASDITDYSKALRILITEREKSRLDNPRKKWYLAEIVAIEPS